MANHNSTSPHTEADPDERARVLAQIYSLLIELAAERTADQANAITHTQTEASDCPKAQEVR